MLAGPEENKFTNCIYCNRISLGPGHDTISEISLKKFLVQQRESSTLSSTDRQRGVQVKKTEKKLFCWLLE
jgi:hypothetical protein